MTLRFTNLTNDQIPIEFTGLTPAKVAGTSLAEIRRRPIWQGNRLVELGKLFRVEGDPASLDWVLTGDWANVHALGAEMESGRIVLKGSAGRRVGLSMRGGRIEVRGEAGDWLGAEMTGGMIRVRGSVGSHVGAATRGAKRGMSGGMILIDGDAGDEVGSRMRRGVIAIAGSAGENLGYNMLAGTILVFGRCGARPGSGMRRGTIGIFGSQRPTLLPTFRAGYRGPLPMLRLLESTLAAEEFALDALHELRAEISLHHGDLLASGRGELLLAAAQGGTP